MQVFVLLFDEGTENLGLHSILIGNRNLVLMFEQEDDATRYALLLEAQDFPVPTVEAMEQTEIEEFCEGAGYESRFVPAGFVPQTDDERVLLAPPETNLEETDWQVDAKPETPKESESELERLRRKLEGLL
jgi:Protein of unknown function (DUF3110)